MAFNNNFATQRSAGQVRIAGRSFTSMDPERQCEILMDNARPTIEVRPAAPRNARPPHMAWMAPDVDASEGGSNRYGR